MELPFDPVELIAIDAPRNVHRRWRMAAMRDLFGTLMIETQWGRVGRPGQRLTRSFPDEATACAYADALLRKRATATRRIGVGYVSREGR